MTLETGVDGGPELRVGLADDAVEHGGGHALLLQLGEGASRLDAAELGAVADQQHAGVVPLRGFAELTQLARAGE